jgi:hypothetical protein
MSGVKQLSDYSDTKLAAAPLTSSGDILGTKINATGFRRAHFVFVFGTPLAGAVIMSGAGIYNTSAGGSSSGAFALITSASFVSSWTTAQGSNQIGIIDVAVDQAKPWLIVSNFAAGVSNFPAACIVNLYNADASDFGTKYGASAARIVTV